MSASGAHAVAVLVVQPSPLARRGLAQIIAAAAPRFRLLDALAAPEELSDEALVASDLVILPAAAASAVVARCTALEVAPRVVALATAGEARAASRGSVEVVDEASLDASVLEALAGPAVDRPAPDAPRRTDATVRAPHGLTRREQQALELVVAGRSNREIAWQLGISANGAKRHVANVLMKLHATTRTMAAAIAVRDGIVEVPA